MPAKTEWPAYPEGVRVFWKGLELDSIIPFEPGQAPLLPSDGFDAFLPLLAIAAIVWAGFLIYMESWTLTSWAYWCLFIFLAAWLCIYLYKSSPQHRSRAVFKGNVNAQAEFPSISRYLRRHGMSLNDVTAEILPDGNVWTINGKRVRRNIFRATPRIVAYSRPDEALSLSYAERTELESVCQRSYGLYSRFFVALPIAWIMMTNDIPAIKQSSWLGLKLLSLIVFAMLSTAVSYILSRPIDDLTKDVKARILEQDNGILVLKYSRKPWIVDGKPAAWRLKGLTAENLKSLEASRLRSSSPR